MMQATRYKLYMNPRTQEILKAVIRDFIETGEPVSSKKICRKCDFGVKDATIRNELNYLVQEEYLGQPHTSSGRVPTDKGYKFIVQTIIDDESDDMRIADKILAALKQEFSERDFGDFVEDLSDELELLGIGYAAAHRRVYKSGLDELFGHLISDYWPYNHDDLFEIVRDFEMIDRRVDDLLNFISEGEAPKVFIGRSPITKSSQLSVIADRYELDGQPFILAAVGPKRMDYDKNLRFFKQLREVIGN